MKRKTQNRTLKKKIVIARGAYNNSYTKSKRFLERVTSAFITNILYYRNLGDKHLFEKKQYLGCDYWDIKRFSKGNIPTLVRKWIHGINEAIKKKYLKTILLSISDKRTSVVYETYAVYYKYRETETGIEWNINDEILSEEFKDCILLHNKLQNRIFELPASQFLNVHALLIHTDEAPKDYCAPGLQNVSGCQERTEEYRKYYIGSCATPYHKFKFTFKVKQDVPYDVSGSESVMEEETYCEERNSVEDASPDLIIVDEEDHSRDEIICISDDDQEPAKDELRDSGCPPEVKCLCQRVTKFFWTNLVKCNGCQQLQHQECYGILDSSLFSLYGPHYCKECCIKDRGKKCTDPSVLDGDPTFLEKLCCYRLMLAYCLRVKYIPENAKIYIDEGENEFEIEDQTPELQGEKRRMVKKMIREFFHSRIRRVDVKTAMKHIAIHPLLT